MHLRKGSDGKRSWRFYWGSLVAERSRNKSRPMRDGEILVRGATSNRTQGALNQLVMTLAQVLRFELGFKLDDPAGLHPKHVDAWANWLNRKRASGEFLPATCAGYATAVRHICRWTDQPRLLEVFERHLQAQTTARRLVTERDKSFLGNGVDLEQVICRIWPVHPWVAMALLAQHGFGLRRREAVQLHPLRDIRLGEGYLDLRVGAKGGRPRVIPIDTEARRHVAEQLMDFSRWCNLAVGRVPNAIVPLPPLHLQLHQALTLYGHVVARAGLTLSGDGVTGHGLRAGYVCERLQELGITPVVRGGQGRLADKDQDRVAHRLVSESVGHSRKSVIGAYAGSPGVRERVLASEKLRAQGLLLPGKDPRTVELNARRITEYLAACKVGRAPESEVRPENAAVPKRLDE